MHLFLLVLGAVISIAGVGAVVYGAANIDYGFGHTLLVVGTTVAGSGLVVVALAIAVRELRRMADLMAARPPDLRAPATPAAELQAPAIAREERAGRKPEQDTRRDRPRFGAPDAAPSIPYVPTEDADAPPLPSTPRWTRPAAPEDTALRPSMLEGFAASPPGRRGKDESPAEATGSPGAPSQRQAGASFDRLPGESGQAASGGPAAEILKSGVVDGMAYTLYADGSIEAELPQGTMRFSSIEELRQHLEGG